MVLHICVKRPSPREGYNYYLFAVLEVKVIEESKKKGGGVGGELLESDPGSLA